MTDAVSPPAAAVAYATGVGVPALWLVGLDPANLIYALIGCIIVQALLPAPSRTFAAVLVLTTGSVLFAGLAAPLLTARAVEWAHHWVPKAQPEAIAAATAACLGAFAQPIVLGLRKAVDTMIPGVIARLRAVFSPGRSGDV